MPTLPALASFTLANEWARLWHRRMGHASQSTLQQMKKAVLGMDMPDECACEPCVRTRARAKPHKGKSRPAEYPFEYISLDLAGPYRKAYDGSQYAGFLKCNHTQRAWMGCFAQKSWLQSRDQ
ncbi:hypothetical protein BDV12DRAFT_204263 [Aspergillus spectabilis]